VLLGDVRLWVRDIIRQVRNENDVDIFRGVLSSDHVHMFVSAPSKLVVSDLIRLMKGRWSHKVQREFPQLKKRSWGGHFWGRGTFQPATVPSPKTSDCSTSEIIFLTLPTPVGSRSVRKN
jgi:putative transposase